MLNISKALTPRDMASNDAPAVAPAYDVEPAGGNRQVLDAWRVLMVKA